MSENIGRIQPAQPSLRVTDRIGDRVDVILRRLNDIDANFYSEVSRLFGSPVDGCEVECGTAIPAPDGWAAELEQALLRIERTLANIEQTVTRLNQA